MEIRFLLLSLLNGRHTREDFGVAADPAFDWNFLFDTADTHGVVPLFYKAISSGNQTIPEEVLQRFRLRTRQIQGRNLSLKRQLLDVLRRLEKQNIDVIPYKGPVLIEELYGNVAMRHFDDLDVLVRKDDVLKVKQDLLSCGYRPKTELQNMTSSQERALLDFQYSYDFVSGTGSHSLEVHWKIVSRSFSMNLNYDEIWARSTLSEYEGVHVRKLSPEDLLLMLCISGAKGVWKRLSKVCDISKILILHSELDMDKVLAWSREAHAERILLLALSLATTLLEAPLPAVIRKEISISPGLQSLTELVTTRMLVSGSAAVIQPEDQFQPLHLRMRERFRDRLRYCLLVTLTPGVGEWAVLTLPDSLYFLYFLLRPLRLASRATTRVFLLLLGKQAIDRS